MLPEAWISKIFAKFEARYGSLFHDRWKGCDLANVKATWAEELAGYCDNPEAIGYALRALAGAKFPPTLPEFIEVCRNAPAKEVPAIPYKPTAEDVQRARAAAESAARAVKPKINDGIDRHWATHPRSAMQLKMIFEAAENDPRFRPCIAEMVEQGICTADGAMLKSYRDGRWLPTARGAA